MPEYRMLGRPVTRVEGTGKVTGRTVYAADLQFPGMLHVKLVRSPYAHARIRSIDTSRARAVEGVEAVVTARDLPPTAGAADSSSPSLSARSNRGEVLLAAGEVVFAGEPVAAVIARDEATAEEARDLVQVDYEELPAVLDPIEAMKEDSPLARSPLSDVDRSES